jgi:leader peptidase (prepilin peptidase)/N-methyltransferase
MDGGHFITSLARAWQIYQIPALLFVFGFGACVGSFMNVVIYRLPEGMSVINPGSRCPTCGGSLKWWQNIPIVSWLMLRGRCAYCQTKISPQYMIIELLMALLFVALFVLLFMVPPRTPWWGEIGGPWWFFNGEVRAAPAFIAHVFLIAGLIGMFMIDARTFTIPLEIPVWLTITAFIAYLVQAFIPPAVSASAFWPIPPTDWAWSLAAMGGMAGLAFSLLLLRLGAFRRSFADYDSYLKDGELFADYPHARREMAVELFYLLPCIALFALGWFIGDSQSSTAPPVAVQAIGGTCLGYLVGGGVVWLIRILGTLSVGREAMGLGDVHMMAAVGAVLGWQDPIWAFFLAPFLALGWVFMAKGLATMFRSVRRELPFGPHLALATLIVMFLRPGVDTVRSVMFPHVKTPPMPMLHQAPQAPAQAPQPSP